MSFKINIVGGGICGLGSAWCLSQQFPDCDISILSEDWHPNTTSDRGFGIIVLRCIDFIDDINNVLDYVKATVRFCQSLKPEDATEMGIKLLPSVTLMQEASQEDIMNSKYCQETGLNMRLAAKHEIESLGFQIDILQRLFDGDFQFERVKFYFGNHYVIDTSIYLPWLSHKLLSLRHKDGRRRVEFVKKRLLRLSDAGSCDLLINCSGLGAKELAADPYVLPIRGQYLSLDAPEQKRLLLMNHTFIVPRFNDIAVGSVYQIGQSSCALNRDDTEDILQRAEVAMPGIRSAKIHKIDVGIRPGRIGGPRVELETIEAANKKQIPVIHNYGHGPRGIAQHYGCALKVCKLASSVIKPLAARL